MLVVVCHDKETATWAGKPMTLTYRSWTSFTLQPLVLGPHNVPAITDPAEVLADTDAAQLWRDKMDTDLSFFRSESAQRLRAQGREQGFEQGLEQGLGQGVARSVLTVLTGRGIELSAAQRKLLADTTDVDQLNEWLLQAVTATRAGELFG
ncbi:hypothetical protein ACFWPK_01140 [Nocardia sp. NPDC058519]|uniref:hypothetical protein n=1 Tax=Nocardia sp. NPDC058519 TaxID=3346535 RepID=UPI003656AF69